MKECKRCGCKIYSSKTYNNGIIINEEITECPMCNYSFILEEIRKRFRNYKNVAEIKPCDFDE